MELKAQNNSKHDHKHTGRIGVVRRKAATTSKHQHFSGQPTHKRADIAAGFVKAPPAQEEESSQAWITSGVDIFILPCCAPSSLPGMEIIEISNKTEHPLKKQSSHSKRAGALQKERDVKQHKQQVLAGLAVSSHNHIRPIATSWDMDTPDLNEEEEAEDRRMDQQKRRLTRVKALDPRVEEIKRKFRASFRPVQSFPNNNIREQTISLSDPLRGRTAINPDYDDNFISVSQNHLNHTYPPRRSSPSAHPALRRRSDVSPPRDYTQATAMARVEKWVQAVGTPPTVATIGSGLGRSDVVTL